ncbi:MAG: dTMP kinase [Victivallales bacterium]
MRGRFITLEGGEGSGKTTQAALLGETLAKAGLQTRVVRSPGGTAVAEKLRTILKTREPGEELASETELLLFGACHSQMVETLLKPELERGTCIISDRFVDSTKVYQGYARGLDIWMLDEINRFACRGVMPDLTIVLDLDPELGMRRSTGRVARAEFENDRFDSETLAFHTAVRNGFLELARQDPRRIKIISAEGSVEDVARAVKDCVNHELGLDLL